MTSVYTTLAGGPQEQWSAGSSWLVCEPERTNLMVYGVKFSMDVWAKNSRAQAHVRTAYDVIFSPLDHNSCYECGLGVNDHRCDGFIYTSDGRVSVFVELKDRKTPNKNLDEIAQACVDANSMSNVGKEDQDEWLPKAVIQLKESILRFKKTNPKESSLFPSVQLACVANRKTGYNQEFMAESTKENFKQITGFSLRINTYIEIETMPPAIRLRILNDKLIDEMVS